LAGGSDGLITSGGRGAGVSSIVSLIVSSIRFERP
jgi:hypothetical protein